MSSPPTPRSFSTNVVAMAAAMSLLFHGAAVVAVGGHSPPAAPAPPRPPEASALALELAWFPAAPGTGAVPAAEVERGPSPPETPPSRAAMETGSPAGEARRARIDGGHASPRAAIAPPPRMSASAEGASAAASATAPESEPPGTTTTAPAGAGEPPASSVVLAPPPLPRPAPPPPAPPRSPVCPRPAVRYPSEARRRQLEGEVALRLVVRADGTISDAQILQSAGETLDQAVLAVVRTMRCEPAREGSQAVTGTLPYRVRFVLEDE